MAATLKGNPEIVLIEIQRPRRRARRRRLQHEPHRGAQPGRPHLPGGKGVEAGRLNAHGYGETRPVCNEHNEECWSRNRRVEFVIEKRSDEGAK